MVVSTKAFCKEYFLYIDITIREKVYQSLLLISKWKLLVSNRGKRGSVEALKKEGDS